MVKSAADLATAFSARYPNASASGSVDSISASAESGTVDSVQAMAVKGFASVSGALQYVRAKEHFYVGGELIAKGDYVQVTEGDAGRLERAGRAVPVSDADVAAAQKKDGK